MIQQESQSAVVPVVIEFRLDKPWIINLPEGRNRREDIQSALDLGEVYVELMSPEEHWRWVFPKDCVRGGIEADVTDESVTVRIDFVANVRGLKPGVPSPDPKRWRLQTVNFGHVFGAIYPDRLRPV